MPDEEQEAVHHLVRARLFRQRQITRSKHRIMGILRTTEHRFTGSKSNWTKKHRAWLAALRREITGPLHTVLTSELEYLEYLETSQCALDAEMATHRPWRMAIEALCCFKGIKTLTAMTIMTEIGNIKRFRSPRQLMGYTGLVPIAVKAQQRLQRRYYHLSQTKHTNKATTAVARELCGFLWSALWEVENATLH